MGETSLAHTLEENEARINNLQRETKAGLEINYRSVRECGHFKFRHKKVRAASVSCRDRELEKNTCYNTDRSVHGLSLSTHSLSLVLGIPAPV